MAEYINLEAVKEIMQKYRCSDCTSEKSLDCPLCQLHRPFAEISKIPTADVQEVRHGRWIYTECEFNLPKCSICGSRSHDATYADRDKFCSRCGAKMDGEREVDTNKG